MGYSFSAGSSINTSPSPLANASRASSMEIGRSVSTRDTFGVGAESGNTYAGSADFYIRVHNLAGLVEHLHLLFGITVVGEYVDLRNEVECQLVSEFFNGYGFACQYLAVLLVQLIHGSGAGTTGQPDR